MKDETATVLDMLYVTDETLTADEIAAATKLPVNDVEQALSMLEQHNYVDIGVKANSANFHDISITRRGAQAVEGDLPYADEYRIRFDPVSGYGQSSGKA